MLRRRGVSHQLPPPMAFQSFLTGMSYPIAALVLAFTSAATPAQTQILQLDTGGHQGDIKDVIFTRDGTQIISAGDDKVIRVWDWRKGQTVRTIRGQVRPGNSGKIFALALSPDEKWIASAGWM